MGSKSKRICSPVREYNGSYNGGTQKQESRNGSRLKKKKGGGVETNNEREQQRQEIGEI